VLHVSSSQLQEPVKTQRLTSHEILCVTSDYGLCILIFGQNTVLLHSKQEQNAPFSTIYQLPCPTSTFSSVYNAVSQQGTERGRIYAESLM